MTEATAVVWEGSDALRAVLRPLDELRTHPDNPWHGDVDEISASLRRFGQVRPVLVTEDGTIVAGNHTYLAARSLDWTHVAALPNEFASAEDARAYLLADNRLPELGDYERAELRALLEDLEEFGRWEGTGYRVSDLDDLRQLEAAAAVPPPPMPEPDDDPVRPPVPELREVVLMFQGAQREEFGRKLAILIHEWGTEGVTETVLRALREEAVRLNLGTGP